MSRIILLTDFSESYAQGLLKGIAEYSRQNTPWVLCRMPLSYREIHGMKGVLRWAKKWKADGIIGQFYNSEKVEIFKEAGIVAVAQDFKYRFKEVPNITNDNYLVGKMAADYFFQKGFRNFAFYGFKGIVWSMERCDSFREQISQHGFGDNFYEYQNPQFEDLWYYESSSLNDWLKSLPKPIALMTCDDNQGHFILEACRDCHINIPEEISVLGVDNDENVCNLSDPPLSSIGLNVVKGGYETAKLLDAMINNKNCDYQDVVIGPTYIVTRQSTDIYSTSDHHVSVVLKYIHQNSDKKINVNDIIPLVPLSRRLLENRFKQVTGMPIYQYLFNLRMKKLAQKLLETNAPILDIALQIGFSDYKNISRQFKTVMGCTPTEYREMHVLKRKPEDV